MQEDMKNNPEMETENELNVPTDQEHTEETHTSEEDGKKKEKKKNRFGFNFGSDENETKVAELEEQVKKAQMELGEQKDKFIRLYAEFDTFRRRQAKEKLDLELTASRKVIQNLLPVKDDFERAIEAAHKLGEPLSEGTMLVIEKFFGILENQGLKAMDSTGQLFDSEFHEAVTEFPAPTEDLKGKVIDTLEKGYLLNDHIIRFAKVVVGK